LAATQTSLPHSNLTNPLKLLQNAQAILAQDPPLAVVYKTLNDLKEDLYVMLYELKYAVRRERVAIAQEQREAKAMKDTEACEQLTHLAERLADNAGYTIQAMQEQCRTQERATVRHLIMYALRQQGASLVLIARVMHRDHSCVVASYKRVRALIDTQDPYTAEVWRKVFRTDFPTSHFAPLPVGGDGGGPSSAPLS
jgi:chromosomal replication initiation ATPase DnaA